MKKKKKIIEYKNKRTFEKWIIKQVDYYLPILGLQLNSIKIEFGEDTKFLEITVSYPYLDPTIKYSDKALKDYGEGKMTKDRILHELCHILTDPLYSKATSRYVSQDEILDEREKLTDIISSILRKYC